MDNLADFLKNGITRKMPLDDMVDVFEKMCDIPMENDMILFETGTSLSKPDGICRPALS